LENLVAGITNFLVPPYWTHSLSLSYSSWVRDAFYHRLRTAATIKSTISWGLAPDESSMNEA
jgi:hypothetical protein